MRMWVRLCVYEKEVKKRLAMVSKRHSWLADRQIGNTGKEVDVYSSEPRGNISVVCIITFFFSFKTSCLYSFEGGFLNHLEQIKYKELGTIYWQLFINKLIMVKCSAGIQQFFNIFNIDNV